MFKLKDKQISPVDVESRKKLNITSGDTVKVWQKIQEKGKIRLQAFEGTVIARKHGGEAGATITVRRVGNDGIGIEKIFPLYSPNIDKIEVVKRVQTRRSKLYFLRTKTSKQVRDKLRRALLSKDSSISETQQQKQKVEEEKTEETEKE